MNQKMFKQSSRRFITLVEIMIVMFLIALITGVVAYNYRGTLEEGKAFKTRVAIEKITTILNLAIAEDPDAVEEMSGNGWQRYVEKSPMIQDPKSALKDGWGGNFRVEIDPNSNQVFVMSDNYNQYLQKKKQ